MAQPSHHEHARITDCLACCPSPPLCNSGGKSTDPTEPGSKWACPFPTFTDGPGKWSPTQCSSKSLAWTGSIARRSPVWLLVLVVTCIIFPTCTVVACAPPAPCMQASGAGVNCTALLVCRGRGQPLVAGMRLEHTLKTGSCINPQIAHHVVCAARSHSANVSTPPPSLPLCHHLQHASSATAMPTRAGAG